MTIKNQIITLLATFCFLAVNAQVPQRFNYQCALRDANGEVAANDAVTMRFTIRQNNAAGAVRYQEIHTTTSNEFGLVNVDIGAGTVTQFSWSNLDWINFTYVLQVEADMGLGFIDMGTSAFDSVPFALLSEKSTNMAINDLYDVETYMGVNEGDILRFNADENWWEPQAFPSIADGVWSSDATNAWRIGGNIGLGISTPTSKLHLHGGGIRITNAAYGSGLIDGLYIGQEAGTGNAQFYNNENTDMVFSTGFLEKFRIGANGPSVPLDYPGQKFHLKSSFPGLGMHFTYTNSGHNDSDGSKIGLNGTGELEINQQENADILFKRNGQTKASITDIGLDVNGVVTANDVNSNDMDANTMNAQNLTAVNSVTAVALIDEVEVLSTIKLTSETGQGNQRVYVNNLGHLYAEPKASKFYNIGPSDLMPWSLSDGASLDAVIDYEIDDGIGSPSDHAFRYMEDDNNLFYAPIHLPHGATVLSATVHVWDIHATRNWAINLESVDAVTGDHEGGFSFNPLNSDDNNGFQTVASECFGGCEVDNQNNIYYLEATVFDPDNNALNPDTDTMRFISVVIEYTEPD